MNAGTIEANLTDVLAVADAALELGAELTATQQRLARTEHERDALATLVGRLLGGAGKLEGGQGMVAEIRATLAQLEAR